MKQGLKQGSRQSKRALGALRIIAQVLDRLSRKRGLDHIVLYRTPLRDAENLRAPSCRNVLPRAMMSVYRDT